MALIIPPGYAQIVHEFALAGDSEPMVSTLGVELDSSSGANADDIADDMFTAWANEMMDQMSSAYTLTGVTAYVGQDASSSLVVTSTETPVTGTLTGDVVPQNTAMLVRKRTDLGGRRGRGRMYLPGVLEGRVGNTGILTTAAQTAIQAALDSYYDFLTAGVGARLYPPVVLHRSEGAGVEPLPTPITRLTIDARVATQRRRLRP